MLIVDTFTEHKEYSNDKKLQLLLVNIQHNINQEITHSNDAISIQHNILI